MKLGLFCTLDRHAASGTTAAQEYRQAVERAEQAERLGLESFWVAEHHFAPYGIAPDPAVLLAAIAARTRRLRLGTAAAVLPLDLPLRTAETYALLDQVSGGRLEFGVASGYLRHEFEGFGVDLAARRERFDEALAVVRRAWAGGAISFAGAHFRVEAPPLNVLPLQPGGPCIHVCVTRPPAAPFVGDQGLALAMIPYVRMNSEAELAETIALYRAALPPGAAGSVTVALHAYCGEEPADTGYAEAEAALQLYLRTRVVPGARYGGGPICRDFVLFGGTEELAARLRALEAIGVDRVLAAISFGALPARRAAASLERLARLAG